MKDIIQPTPESITETFKATFNFFQNQLEPSGYDAHLQKLAGHCLKHGLEDAGCIIGLMKFAVQLSLYSPTVTFPKIEDAVLNDYLMKKWQFRKDLAILTSIFKNGRSITIEATMPDGRKENHITFPIETSSLLHNMAFFSLNSLLANECYMHGITEKKEELDPDTYDILIGYNFKDPYTDEELAGIIESESKKISNETTLKGRKVWEIPKLGCMVHDFIEACGDGLASLPTDTQKYCLIGDLIWELLPSTPKEAMMNKLTKGSTPDEEWAAMDGSDKSKMVKSWEKSYLTASRKIK